MKDKIIFFPLTLLFLFCSIGLPSQETDATIRRFLTPFINKTISSDSRRMKVAANVDIYYGKFVVVTETEGGYSTYRILIAADTEEKAKQIRDKYCPKVSEFPPMVYFEVWTPDETIVGRDRLGDYVDYKEE